MNRFQSLFILSISSGLLAALVCFIYIKIYTSILVDFSESVDFFGITSFCTFITFGAFFIHIALHRIIKNQNVATFLLNFILSITSIILVFWVLKMDDPEFKNEDAQLMSDYYKGFLVPMIFFPTLSWFTLSSLFLKK